MTHAVLDAGLHALFDEMFEGVQLVDADLRYRYVNATAARHGQRRREELIGARMPDLYPGIERTEVVRRIEECLRTHTPQQLINHFTYPDGSQAWFDLRMAPVAGGVLILSIDVSGQKRIEAELRETVDALEAADRRKDAMLAMLAHELRNPLAPIANAVHVLRERAGQDPAVRRAGETTERQLRHMTRMVDDLLDATRLRGGRVTLARVPLDLARLVRETAADREPLFAGDGIALGVLTPGTSVRVLGDETRLGQVLTNLLDNARKFTPRGGRVEVVLTTTPPVATVAVRDTGIGIAPGDLPLVFDPLFQADTSLDRARGGLGLGLAVAKNIVELHGGRMDAASAGPGGGATVRLHLPEDQAGPVTPVRKRVLVIEDNRDAADTLGMILELWGYEVDLAYTGTDGVYLARTQPPDVVLCDLGLPGMDGYAVARLLREHDATRHVRLIAITGYNTADDRGRSQAAGFDLHLAKPVPPERLKEHLER